MSKSSGKRPPATWRRRTDHAVKSDLQQLKRDLRFTNSLLTTEMESSPDGILVVDQSGQIVSFNQRFVTIAAIPDELVKAGIDEPVLAAVTSQMKDEAGFLARVRYFYEHPDQIGHDEVETKDGRFLDRHTAPLYDAEHTYLGRVWFFRDITEQRRTEGALRQERDFSAALFAAVPEILVLLDKEGRNIRWNANLAAFLGLSDNQLLGMDARLSVAEGDRERVGNAIRQALEEGRADIEVGLLKKGTEERRIHVVGHRLDLGLETYVLAVGIDVTESRLSERLLRESEERFRTIFDSVSDGIFLHEMDNGAIVECNRRACDMLGYSRLEIFARDIGALSAGGAYNQENALRWIAAAKSGTAKVFEWHCKTKSGSTFWVEVSLRRTKFGGGEFILSTMRDISERKKADEALRQRERDLNEAQRLAHLGSWVWDPKSGAVTWSDELYRMFDLSPGRRAPSVEEQEEIFVPESYLRLRSALNNCLRTGVPYEIDLEFRRADGSEGWINSRGELLRNGYHDVALLRGTALDITKRKHAEARILQMARFDGLTGLANREVFIGAVHQAIGRARRGGKNFSVLYLDLDHFKDVNDTLGHPMGDLLLQSVAERLRAGVRETDTVARFGGDEFAILGAELEEPADAGMLAEKILGLIAEPFLIGGNDIRTGTSIGIAVSTPDNVEAETLMSHADVALYRAKSEERGTYRFFTDAMDVDVRSRVTLNSQLRNAIGSDELFLLYQPQVEVETGRIVGLEALVRWRHPQRGILSPRDFIAAAEKGGLIVSVGHWVLHESCRQAREWLDAGIDLPVMAVNFSATQFKRPQELERDIAAVLAETNLPAHFLQIELTETSLMETSREHNDVLQRLHREGISFAIDDFGTGYSSLDYLRRFPFNRLKIAQDFVADLTTDSGDAAIVKAAISLARELKLNIIAEGVETEEQIGLLKGWGCHQVQGFYFSKPMSADDLAPLLRQGRIAPAKSVYS